jgi:hypothetical protein
MADAVFETYQVSRSTYIGGLTRRASYIGSAHPKHRLVRLYIDTEVGLGHIMRVHIGRHLVIGLSSKGQNPF